MTMGARASSTGGTTLVEVILGMTLLSMMLGSIGIVSLSSKSAFSRGTARSSAELRSGIAMKDILFELEMAISSSITPALVPGVGVPTIQYQRALDWNGTDVVASEARVLRFEYEPLEADDAVDDDGDGLIDEGQLVLIEDFGLPTQQRRVLARGVSEYQEGEINNGVDDNGNGLIDEPGFVIEPRGGTLDVTLTLVDATADGTEVMTRTVRTSILLRN